MKLLTLMRFSKAKRFSFRPSFEKSKKSLYNDSLHLVVKRRFGLNDYLANSAVQEARALFSSRVELNKLYINQTDEKIKHIKKKLKAERSFLTQLKKIKESLIKGNLRFPKNLSFSLQNSGVISLKKRASR